MAQPVLKDAEAFEFLTAGGLRLELFGETVGWQDEIPTGIIEHRVVQRTGALHQDVGAPPRKFTFNCVVYGPSVQGRWRSIVGAIRGAPRGTLIHPRHGHLSAVCEGLSSKEDPGSAIDTIEFSIKFAETGLREPSEPSASASAQAASASAATMQGRAARYPVSVQQGAARVAGDVSRFVATVAAVSIKSASVFGLLGELRTLRASTDALLAALPNVGDAALRGEAALAYARCLAAYNAVRARLPPVVTYRVPSTVSLSALAARLYGGRYASEQIEILKQLNFLRAPHAIPTGTLLQIYSPDAVRGRLG